MRYGYLRTQWKTIGRREEEQQLRKTNVEPFLKKLEHGQWIRKAMLCKNNVTSHSFPRTIK